MCNGHNHPVICTCGFGGAGHSGKRTENNNPAKQVRFFNNQNYQSYTVPNAKCPVCGTSVFFYKSENGGSVFFDELGPPWPKHACTDNRKWSYHNLITENGLKYGNTQREWQKDGWIPVIVLNNYKSSYSFFVERIDLSGIHITINVYSSDIVNLTKKDTLIYFKRKNSQAFILKPFNVFDKEDIELQFDCKASKLDKFCGNNLFLS